MNHIVAEPKPAVSRVEIKGAAIRCADKVLTPDALEFLAELHERFNPMRLALLELRRSRQARINAGHLPDFLNSTGIMRESDWQTEPIPRCLQDRRVEITGPVDRKMIINALNSGANVFMADFEDSTSPTWENIIEGQQNLYDAVRRTITFQSPEGKSYRLKEDIAVLMVRPRGWHLEEAHLLINGAPASASLVDFGLFVFLNAGILAQQERGPFFYLPKLESHLEARLWDQVFAATEEIVGLEPGTIKATVLIETITAAFEMEEIVYELRHHMAGLNAGRWDYIFSIIKKFHRHKQFTLPDRSLVTMDIPFMKAYASQLVKVCHKRGTHAIGGMSAFIPSKDLTLNEAAFARVRADKEREVALGYDGTWVAHPGLVAVAREIFDKTLGQSPNQKHVLRDEIQVTQSDLLDVASAGRSITMTGVRTNINVALMYMESWLNGVGAAALHNLMEDAATAEISRAQLWQWVHHRVQLDDGSVMTPAFYLQICEDEFGKIRHAFISQQRETLNLATARLLLDRLVLSQNFEEFLTTKAYLHIQ